MAEKTMMARAMGLGLALFLALAPRSATAADMLSGEWEGAYSCYQGLTALTLSIEPDGEQWAGTFTFGPVKGNKAVPDGAYALTITQEDGNYHMEPGAWIEQPEGYVTVALDGTMSPDLKTLAGTVLFDGCQSFQVSRTTPLPVPQPKGKGTH
ncbi:MAG: hypothetical protein ABI414_13670 [Devosia sp.]